MRALREIVKILFDVVLGLILLLIAALVLLLDRPQLLYNTANVERAATLLKNSGINLSWRTLDAKVRSRSFYVKDFFLGATDFCYQGSGPELKACFGQLALNFEVSFARLIPRVRVIGPVDLLGGNIRVERVAKAEEPPQAKKKAQEPFRLPKVIEHADLKALRVEVDDFRMIEGPKQTRGGMKLKVNGKSGDLVARVRTPELAIESDARITIDPGRIRAVISGSLAGKNLPLRQIRIQDCALELRHGKTPDSRLLANCPVQAAVPVPPKPFTRFKIPTRAGARLQADLVANTFPPTLDSQMKGRLKLQLEPILTPLLQGSGSVESKVDGVPSRFPEGMKAETDLALKVTVRDFRKAVRELHSTPWAVPAPFRVLNGTVDVEASGRFQQEAGVIPIRVRTNLASKYQKLMIDSQGKVTLPNRPAAPVDIYAALELSDVQLELPKLDLAQPPVFLPDPRISRKKVAKEKPSPVHLALDLKTPPGRPARLLSNLAKDPVPIDVQLHIETDKALSGNLNLHGFGLELFHRDASVDHFLLTLADPSDDSTIDGTAKVTYTDYTISLLFVGTLGKPRLILQSEPPLPQQQLVSVLLFGEPIDALDPDRMSTVGNAQAALADGALSLASMYALASTPIQSVGYDPQTGFVSMKVRLAAGTSLNVGTGPGDVTEVGIRKRLGPHWTVTTQVGNSADPTDKSVAAFLEWTLRY